MEIDISFVLSKNSFDYSFCDLGKLAGFVKFVVTVVAKGKVFIKIGKIIEGERFIKFYEFKEYIIESKFRIYLLIFSI